MYTCTKEKEYKLGVKLFPIHRQLISYGPVVSAIETQTKMSATVCIKALEEFIAPIKLCQVTGLVFMILQLGQQSTCFIYQFLIRYITF